MSVYNKIASGSTGNCIIYHDSIMVDCGVSIKLIENIGVSLILLTHEHRDHINISTIKKLCFENPLLRVGCCEWMKNKLNGIRNVDVYELGETYDYGQFKIKPFKLYHDVKNCGYKIFKDNHKIIHATDTAHLDGIEAKDYDLYAIEHNYCEDEVLEAIDKKMSLGIYSYEKGALETHLSEQKAKEFIYRNKKESSEVLRLHESTRYL